MKVGCSIQKYKAQDIGAIEKEQKRLYTFSKYENDVNLDKSYLNVIESVDSWKDTIKDFKSLAQENGQKFKSGKNAPVELLSFIESVPNSWGRDKVIEYFEESAKLKENLLKEYGLAEGTHISHIIHFDETNPHCTDEFIPIKDGRFNAKELVSLDFTRRFQKELYSHYQDFATRNPELEVMEQPEFNAKETQKKRKEELDFKIKVKEKYLENLENNIAFKEKQLDVIPNKEEVLEKASKWDNLMNTIYDNVRHMYQETRDSFKKIVGYFKYWDIFDNKDIEELDIPLESQKEEDLEY